MSHHSGTSLTDEQASQLARLGKNPIVTDADIAGRVAAERDFWLLTPYHLAPDTPCSLKAPDRPTFSPSSARQRSLLCWTRHGRSATLIDERLTSLPPEQAQHEAARILPARPPGSGTNPATPSAPASTFPCLQFGHPPRPRQGVEPHLDPRRAATTRCTASTRSSSWLKRPRSDRSSVGRLASQLDQRLLRQGDWPALARS